MRKGMAMQETLSIMFSVLTVGLIWFVFVYKFPGAVPVGCDYDNICENSYTEKMFMYDNRMENEYL